VISFLIGQDEVWPNFFIVGAPKAGTTSLYYYLKDIPGIYMSPIKEPNYFVRHAVQGGSFDLIQDKAEYLGLFRNSDRCVAIGEASSTYLWDPDSPKLIHEAVPHARIIMILRDPIDRAYSQYLMRIKYRHLKSSFYDELMRDYNSKEKVWGVSDLYIEFGMYHEQVKRYLDQFGKEHIKIILFEEFIHHPTEKVNEVLSFLGVNYRATDADVNEQHNPFLVPRSPLSVRVYAFFRWLRSRNIKFYRVLKLLPDSLTESQVEKFLLKKAQKPLPEPQAIKFLQEIYREDIVRLEALLGRSLPWHSVSKFSKDK
jgi:Sulfotransferase domain